VFGQTGAAHICGNQDVYSYLKKKGLAAAGPSYCRENNP